MSVPAVVSIPMNAYESIHRACLNVVIATSWQAKLYSMVTLKDLVGVELHWHPGHPKGCVGLWCGQSKRQQFRVCSATASWSYFRKLLGRIQVDFHQSMYVCIRLAL